MKKIFSFTLLSLIVLFTNAQKSLLADAKQLTASAPAVDPLVLNETEFDFGKIPQGKPVTHIFSITNKGTDSLKLINVQASCGCTTPMWDKTRAIAPGETSKITVGYNAAGEGAFTKPVTIFYNGNLNKQITIKGIVWKTPASSAPENESLNELKN